MKRKNLLPCPKCGLELRYGDLINESCMKCNCPLGNTKTKLLKFIHNLKTDLEIQKKVIGC